MKNVKLVYSLFLLIALFFAEESYCLDAEKILNDTSSVVFSQERYGDVYCNVNNNRKSLYKAESSVDSILNNKEVKKEFDTFFDSKSKEIIVKKFPTKHPVYYGISFKTLPFPVEDIIKIIEDYRSYAYTFRYINDFQLVSENTKCFTAYVQLKVPFFKSWFILDLDSIVTDDSLVRTTYFSKNHFPPLNKIWEQRTKSKLTYLAREISIRYILKPVDKNRTRVAYLLAVDSKTKVPGWIFKLVGRWVFPRFMKDIEKAVRYQVERKK